MSELALSLEDAILREQAVAEALRIINRSRGDIAVAMSAILGFTLELCEAEFGILFDRHGGARFAASHTRGIPAALKVWLDAHGVFAAGPRTGLGRLATHNATVNIVDVRAEDVFQSDDPVRYATAILGEARSVVAIPMLSGDRMVGAFTIYRQSVRPFSHRTATLAQVFADQSVIPLDTARMIGALRVQAADA
jgi:GAF domain-containing protein